MDDSHRIMAPKPIRLKSNLKGVKIDTVFEGTNNRPYSLNTPKLSKLLVLSPNKRSFQNRINNFFDKSVEDYQNFEKDLHLSDSTFEILSILNNESTNLESINTNESINEDFLNDEIKSSEPPARSKNPFYKNFENSSEEFDCYGSTDPK